MGKPEKKENIPKNRGRTAKQGRKGDYFIRAEKNEEERYRSQQTLAIHDVLSGQWSIIQ